jgi:hypothetical protein
VIAQGHSNASLKNEVRIPATDLVWMPYDTPTLEDLAHVYRELTVPIAPFDGRAPDPLDPIPHALVLVGDQPHEPGHIIEGLKPIFEAVGVVPHFAVDVRALTAGNLSKVKLLVILRDGLERPTDDPALNYRWMTLPQQEAVVRFVTGGGAFLNLHNSMGLYPDAGPYLKLVGGRYIGHGPLERFRVEVVDADHPITRGVDGFSVADEQHTLPYDGSKVHLLLRNRSDDGKVIAPRVGRTSPVGVGSAIWPMATRVSRWGTRCIGGCCKTRSTGVFGAIRNESLRRIGRDRDAGRLDVGQDTEVERRLIRLAGTGRQCRSRFANPRKQQQIVIRMLDTVSAVSRESTVKWPRGDSPRVTE